MGDVRVEPPKRRLFVFILIYINFHGGHCDALRVLRFLFKAGKEDVQ